MSFLISDQVNVNMSSNKDEAETLSDSEMPELEDEYVESSFCDMNTIFELEDIMYGREIYKESLHGKDEVSDKYYYVFK